MPALESSLRRQLEAVIIQARDVAEGAARSALQKRAVDVAEPFSHFGAKDKELRNRLRARGRQVGDVRNADKTQSIDGLTQELAYEYWHRMLFARFLAENHLLMHPDGVAVTLEECADLAPTADPPAANGFVLAARYASLMLPQIFRTDDVLLEIDFAPEHRLALEKLLASLPRETFLADDSLGWVYQFWQSKRKDEVNKIGDKIDGRTLPAVTQLFTEHYMVEFLLHNTVGAWWCAKEGIEGPPGGAGIPNGQSPVEMPYLRWRDDGTPAAGKFEGWPKTLAEFTMLDPCCGSGHFLVAAFNLLVPLRMHDQRMTAEQACEAVLRDNIFGLELDPRCTQIAAFALALAAWKYPQAGGYRALPTLNIACTGIGPNATEEEWLKLADSAGMDRRTKALAGEFIRDHLRHLHRTFTQAPTLGSLLDPTLSEGNLFSVDFDTLKPYLQAALSAEKDQDAHERVVAAAGIVKAAELLASSYTLVITNVPYLGRGKQSETLKEHIEAHYAIAKADLATAFVLRCLDLCAERGTTALVTPQNWLFLTSYKKLREDLLKQQQWNLVAKMGSRAFETISGEVVNVALLTISAVKSDDDHLMAGLDVAEAKTPSEKAARLADHLPSPMKVVEQAGQLKNPDAIISLADAQGTKYLGEYAKCLAGILNGDSPKFRRSFWEFSEKPNDWVFQQSTVENTMPYGGREGVIFFDEENGHLREDETIRRVRLHDSDRRGNAAWGKLGVGISQMDTLPATLYSGNKFDSSLAVIYPQDQSHVLALWAYCQTSQFREDVRKINQKVSVENGYLGKIPFDLAHWQAVAAEKYPDGLPEPHSDDPTQWLFKGDIATSTDPLQVAVARLLGYCWPDQPQEDAVVDPFVDDDGIVCLPGVRHESPAAERLADLLRAVEYKSEVDLAAWLRDKFFEEHCKRFHQRPFIWHIWDGRKDGFSALVNYHKLTNKALENLTYSHLGDWITAQNKSDKAGADLRLGAAQELQEKLKLILAGEPPYDIFVRWKPLHEQAIGWHPDLNDGVRMNIRPFMEAGILRKNPNIKWTKDRGTEPERDKHDFPWFWKGSEFIGDRVNDVHLTNADKMRARAIQNGAES